MCCGKYLIKWNKQLNLVQITKDYKQCYSYSTYSRPNENIEHQCHNIIQLLGTDAFEGPV